jgi:hypothetical protein
MNNNSQTKNAVPDVESRAKIGKNAGVVGIGVNLFLFVIKLVAGILSGAVSIIADAINNLTDAASSILVLVGYVISAKPADHEHPYGHARMEYLCSLFISTIVTVLGIELFISSVKSIIGGGDGATYSTLSIVIMSTAVLVKVGLAVFYSRVGKKPIPINVESSVFYGLVDEFYSAKNVKCFMTEDEEIMIFPAAKFPEYFEIAGFYRRKNSGSSEPNEAKNHAEIIQGLADYGIEGDVVYQSVSGKIRCLLHTDAKLDGQRMMCDEYTYQFKDNPHSQKVTKQKQHVFEVRRLSNTSNPNVICQLTLKKHQQDKDDLAAFEALLK